MKRINQKGRMQETWTRRRCKTMTKSLNGKGKEIKVQ